MTTIASNKQYLRETIMRLVDRVLVLEPVDHEEKARAAIEIRLASYSLRKLKDCHQSLSTSLLYLEKQRENNEAHARD